MSERLVVLLSATLLSGCLYSQGGYVSGKYPEIIKALETDRSGYRVSFEGMPTPFIMKTSVERHDNGSVTETLQLRSAAGDGETWVSYGQSGQKLKSLHPLPDPDVVARATIEACGELGKRSGLPTTVRPGVVAVEKNYNGDFVRSSCVIRADNNERATCFFAYQAFSAPSGGYRAFGRLSFCTYGFEQIDAVELGLKYLANLRVDTN